MTAERDSRAAIRRVLAIPAGQLPPGPAHPTQACPECSQLIAAGRHSMDAHRADHRREEARAKKRRAAANHRAAARRLADYNATRKAAPAGDLEREPAEELDDENDDDDAHQEHEPAPFTPAPQAGRPNPEHGEQEQLTL